MVITMTITEFINEFSRNHTIQSVENINSGIIIAPIGDSNYIVRLTEVKE